MALDARARGRARGGHARRAFTLPESPRWLASRGRSDDAREVLARFRADEEVDDELAEIEEQRREEAGTTWRDLRKPELRPALTLGIGAVNVLVTVIALRLVDRAGRRPLLLWGTAGCIAALVLLGGLYLLPEQTGVVGWLIVAGLMVYIASFAASLGIAIWLVNAEVFPTAVRGKAGSLGTITHWGLDFVISLTVLTLIGLVTETGLFWLYAAFGVAGLLFLSRRLPETRGRSLEAIDRDLRESTA